MNYKLSAPNGEVLDEGQGRVDLEGGAVVVSPAVGTPLRIRPADVVELSEPAPYVVRLRLAEGPVLDLSQLGVLRTQLLAQIGEVRAEDTVSALLLAGLGTPQRFRGAANDVEAEIRLYDDALVIVPTAGLPEQVPYAFIEGIDTDASGYKITITQSGGAALVLQRMARMTSQFLDMLRDRVSRSRGRTSAFLHSLLPGLGSIALRSVAGMLRNGVAARKADLDAIDGTVWPSLVKAATAAERTGCVAALERLGEPMIGFVQTSSVERAAAGGPEGWQDPSVAPNEREEAVPAIPGGIGGVMTAGMLRHGPPEIHLGFDGPFEAMGSMLALQMLGNPSGFMGGALGPSGGPEHEATPRPDMTREGSTAASTDYAALSLGGGQPTLMAFAFSVAPSGAVVYEVLNEGDHATYVYRVGPEGVGALNRALVLIGFRVEAIYSDADMAGSRYRHAVERLPYLQLLRANLAGRAIHTDGWEAQLAKLVG